MEVVFPHMGMMTEVLTLEVGHERCCIVVCGLGVHGEVLGWPVGT